MTYTQLATQMRMHAERHLRKTIGYQWRDDRINDWVDTIMKDDYYLYHAAKLITRPVATFTGADLQQEVGRRKVD